MKSNEKILLIMLIILVMSLIIYTCAAPSMDDGWDSGDAGDGWDDDGDGGDDIPPGQLTAGEWSDLDNWDFWTGLIEGQNPDNDWSHMPDYWGVNTLNRYPVIVKYNGEPVKDIDVELLQSGNPIWKTKTDNTGEANLFYSVFQQQTRQTDYDIKVTDGSNSVTVPLDDNATWQSPQLIEISSGFLSKPIPDYTLDLMFMIDTTGSMWDELDYIKAELEDVIQTVNTDNPGLTIRMSCNFYRDYGDDYVVRSFPFTTNLSTVLNQLNAQSADGGGDYPEAVDEALMNAVDEQEHDWSDDAYARLMFLVLDAPPHHYSDVITNVHTSVQEAAGMGIRIIPVAASGADKETEFLLRFIDILTGGTYVFITDHSGIGNDHTEPTVGDYEVELLNELLIRLINEAVDNQQ
jgi:hypothetical protein